MRDALLCSTGVSLFNGVGLSGTVGVGAGAISESDPPALVDCGRGWLSCASAARAPAIRICSSVGIAEADFFWPDLGLARSGAGDSGGLCSEDGVACLRASGLVSRATITSCACIWPERIKLQSTAPKNAFSTTGRERRTPTHWQALMRRRCEFNQLAA